MLFFISFQIINVHSNVCIFSPNRRDTVRFGRPYRWEQSLAKLQDRRLFIEDAANVTHESIVPERHFVAAGLFFVERRDCAAGIGIGLVVFDGKQSLSRQGFVAGDMQVRLSQASTQLPIRRRLGHQGCSSARKVTREATWFLISLRT